MQRAYYFLVCALAASSRLFLYRKFKKFTFDHEAIIERLFGIEYETLPKTLVLTFHLLGAES